MKYNKKEDVFILKKTIFIICLIILILLSICNITYATTMDDIISGGDDFIGAGQLGSGIGLSWEGITQASDLIYNTLLLLGVAIAVIVAAFLGIKFITGSVEEKADIKQSLIPFIIGCVVIFGAFGIWKLVTGILEDVQTSSITTVQVAEK